jgi:hypothetical protein
MTTRTVTMSHAELDRFGVITRVRERRLTQVEAARILDLGVRQVQRLCVAVAQQGADGLISRKRGRPSSRRFPDQSLRGTRSSSRSDAITTRVSAGRPPLITTRIASSSRPSESGSMTSSAGKSPELSHAR